MNNSKDASGTDCAHGYDIVIPATVARNGRRVGFKELRRKACTLFGRRVRKDPDSVDR